MRIGVFDSGVGGITVLAALRVKMPGADYVYFGDTANVPYGTKSAAQVERLTLASAQRLRDEKIDALVIACNTASALALDSVKREMGAIPVFGVVEPGVEAALEALGGMKPTQDEFGDDHIMAPILVLATRATVKSGAYGDALRKLLTPDLVTGRLPCPVIEQACPLLVPMIEEGWLDHPILHQTIAEYVTPHVLTQPPGVALLGCTHYPWIHAAFEKALPGWKVVNSAQAVARTIGQSGLAVSESGEGGARGKVTWIFSDPDAVPQFAQRLIQQEKTS